MPSASWWRRNAWATGAGCSKKGVAYANERVVFGRPIGQNQGVQFPLARAYAELEAADMMCRRGRGAVPRRACLAGRTPIWPSCWPRRRPGRRPIPPCRPMAASASPQEYDIERKWREVRLYQTAPISTNMVLAYVAQHVLGLPRSY